uniref:POP4 domain-containing protein n=1 Tax=Strongyloides venezuelensis TaxID=75913 RepID=A0A0K0FEN8_STRVS
MTILNSRPIVLNEKMTEVEGFYDAVLCQIINLMSSKIFFLIHFKIQKIHSLASTKFILNESTTIVNFHCSRVEMLGRLELLKEFVINTKKNLNGTLLSLYDIPIGKVLATKSYLTFKTCDE